MARVIEDVGGWLMWQWWRLTHPYDALAARRYARMLLLAEKETSERHRRVREEDTRG